MELLSRSFRLERSSSSLRLMRSNRSMLECELASSDSARITGYEKLSESMRFYDEPVIGHRRSKTREAFLGFLCFLRRREYSENRGAKKHIGAVEQKEDKKQREKKRSSWLSDPDRRWPVQGW